MKTLSMMSLPVMASPKQEDSKLGQLTSWMAHLEPAWLDQWPVSPLPTPVEARTAAASIAVGSTRVSVVAPGLVQTSQTSLHSSSAPLKAQDIAAPAQRSDGQEGQDGTAVSDGMALDHAMAVPRSGVVIPRSLGQLASALAVTSQLEPLAWQQQPLMPSQTVLHPATPLVAPLRLSEPAHMPAELVSGEPTLEGCSALADPPHVAKPYTSSLLRVSVTEASVQVTLRDASLSPSAAWLAGSNLAQQLRTRGIEGLRVYVNGQRTDRPAGPTAVAADFVNRTPVFETNPDNIK